MCVVEWDETMYKKCALSLGLSNKEQIKENCIKRQKHLEKQLMTPIFYILRIWQN